MRSRLPADRPASRGLDVIALEAEFNKAYAVPIDRVAHATAYLESHGARLLLGADTPSASSYANPPGLDEKSKKARRP